MPCAALVALFKLLLPCREQTQSAFPVTGFVGQIVRPAAVSVYIMEILMQPLWQEECRDVEILVVRAGQGAGVPLSFGRRHRQRCVYPFQRQRNEERGMRSECRIGFCTHSSFL